MRMALGLPARCVLCEETPHPTGEVAHEAADRLPWSLALPDPAVNVGAGRRVVPAQPDHDDPPERGVGLPVAAAIEAMPPLATGGRVQWRDATQRGERGLGPQPLRVVAGRDE